MGAHELAFVGLAGSGLGTALGVPMVWPTARHTRDVRLLGTALLLSSTIGALISARLAGIATPSAGLEHAINLLGLCAFPFLGLYTRHAAGVAVTRRSAIWLMLPAAAYVVLAVNLAARGADTSVPFVWLLPAVLGFTAMAAATLWRHR